jgi:hypothetical protein
MEKVPTPTTVTCMVVGAQPAFEVYTTEKVNMVAVVPDPGATDPELSVTWWDAPLQLAACAGAPNSSDTVAIRRASRPWRGRRADICTTFVRVAHGYQRPCGSSARSTFGC